MRTNFGKKDNCGKFAKFISSKECYGGIILNHIRYSVCRPTKHHARRFNAVTIDGVVIVSENKNVENQDIVLHW